MGDYDDPWFYSPPLEEESAEQAVVDVEAGAKPSTSALSPVSVDAQVAILQAAAKFISNAHAHAPAPAISTAAASLPVRRGRFLVKPRLLFDWGDPDRHRRVDWSELFGDLIIVAIAIQISTALKYELTGATLGFTAAAFIVFFDAWLFLTLVYICGTLVMAVFISKASEIADVRRGFVLGRLATIASQLALTSTSAFFLPRVRVVSTRMNYGQLANAAVMIASIFPEPVWVTPVLWVGAFIVSYFVSLYSWRPHKGKRVAVPIHVEHMAERFGAFVMIVLGESILAQVLVPKEYGILYFESQPFSAALHAQRRSVIGGRTFSMAHVPLAFLCVTMGSALKILLSHSHDPLHAKDVWLLGGSLTALLVLIIVVRMSHRGFRSELGLLRNCDAAVLVAPGGVVQKSVATTAGTSDTGSGPTAAADGNQHHTHHPQPLANPSSSTHSHAQPPAPHTSAITPATIPMHSTVHATGMSGPAASGAHLHAHNVIQHVASMPALAHPHLHPTGPECTVKARIKYFTQDSTMRRRLLWLARLLGVLLVLGWTILVDRRLHSFSPLSFTGGLLLLLLLLHALDYLDVVSYSDTHQHA